MVTRPSSLCPFDKPTARKFPVLTCVIRHVIHNAFGIPQKCTIQIASNKLSNCVKLTVHNITSHYLHYISSLLHRINYSRTCFYRPPAMRNQKRKLPNKVKLKTHHKYSIKPATPFVSLEGIGSTCNLTVTSVASITCVCYVL